MPTPYTGGNTVGVWGYEGSLVGEPEQTTTPPVTCGVLGQGEHGGVVGTATPGSGVHGINGAGSGTKPTYGCGVWGESDNGYGVYGASATASGVYGTSGPGHYAGEFAGDVQINGNQSVTGNVSVGGDVVLTGSDCAERFDTAEAREIEPGTVVVISDDGTLRESSQAYDKRVAGVVSGAGSYKPAIVLDRHASDDSRASVGLVGKVYCKADAQYGAISVGDLLTTSPTTGHAMKAADPVRAFGAVIGKALAALDRDRGLVPILIALQ
ncbi:MAG TPA: hypothetical protein VFF63_05575 [Candidatus Babeliales bacterium]|nr:hypothetical protein [Candidatus Babeliales bacterium]